MGPKVHGETVRARADALRDRGRALARRFEASQVGRLRRGLTLEDGTLVLTDNYLKVRIPPGHARNEWVDVRILAAEETMTGIVDSQQSSVGRQSAVISKSAVKSQSAVISQHKSTAISPVSAVCRASTFDSLSTAGY